MSHRPTDEALRDAERRDDLTALVGVAERLVRLDWRPVWSVTSRLLVRARAERQLANIDAPILKRPAHRERSQNLAAAAVDILARFTPLTPDDYPELDRQVLFQRYIAALRLWKPIEWSLWLAGHNWRVLSHVGYGLVDLLGWKDSRIAGDGTVTLGSEFPPMPPTR